MYPIDLFLLSKTKPLNVNDFCEYVKNISHSARQLIIRDYERADLYQLIDMLLSSNININCLDGFYYSYSIEQIGKEFDLIKISKDFVLNIEIKSDYSNTEVQPLEKIKKQLLLNRHYLLSINQNIKLYTFVASDKKIYKLKDDLELCESSIHDIMIDINDSLVFKNEDLDNIMCPSNYLVSPFNNVDKFINGQYFLTKHQEQIKKDILSKLTNPDCKFFKINGDAGTGKTLLLYDIAKSIDNSNKICMVHCGKLNQGHFELNKLLSNVTIISAKEFKYFDLKNYDLIMFDETQRLYLNEFNDFVQYTQDNYLKAIFNIGLDQLMQENEVHDNINGEINKLDNIQKYELKNKIRTNENIASFIKNLVNLENKNRDADYKNIDIFYVSTKEECKHCVKYIMSHNYTYISFTPSQYKNHEIDNYIGAINTHDVIGQEFDNVVMIMGQDFQYVNNRLNSKDHPNPNYIFSKLFYQGITRARLKLAIVIVRNSELYKTLISIKNHKEN